MTSETIIYNKETFFKRDNLFWSTIRATPTITFIYALIDFLLNNNWYLLLIISADKIINHSLKTLLQWKFGDDKEICFLGYGRRPVNARNTGCFLKLDNAESTTYGMPSGHSQNAWLFTIYLITVLLKNNPQFIGLRIGLIICYAATVSYSRVIENCHTSQQVFLGGLIGIITGLLYFCHDINIKII